MGESAMLHAGVAAEGGYDSNVFYSEAASRRRMLRVTPFLQLTNATRTGAVPSGVYFDLNTSLTYREYLTDDEQVKAQRAFNPRGVRPCRILLGPDLQPLSERLLPVRVEDPPYVRSDAHITRDDNVANLQLRFTPGGGRLRGLVRFTNVIDIFETAPYDSANSMRNEVMFDGSWLWLPKTALFLQVSQGWVHYLDEAKALQRTTPPTPIPPGHRGLTRPPHGEVVAERGLGLPNAFYAGGGRARPGSATSRASPSQHRPTPYTNLTLGYRHEFRNSIIGTSTTWTRPTSASASVSATGSTSSPTEVREPALPRPGRA